MVKRTIVIFTLLLILTISCAEEQNLEVNNIDEFFTKEREIDLKTEGYLSVRFMEVNEQGEFLVTGRRDKVLLFNESGELIRDLSESAREGYPGLNWSPNRAIFMPDGSIFVQNNAPWGIYFDEKGHFAATAPSGFHVSNRFAASADNYFYSMEITPEEAYIRRLNAEGDEVGRFNNVPERFINLMQRYRVGNQFVSTDQYLFFTMVAEPSLFRLDLEMNEINRYEQPPEYFDQVVEDISSIQQVGPAGLASEISDFSMNYTTSYSLHLVTNDLLLIQFQNRSEVSNGEAGFGIQMVTIDGKFPMESELLTEEWVLTASKGMIYTMERSEEAYSIPKLNVYKLKESFMVKL